MIFPVTLLSLATLLSAMAMPLPWKRELFYSPQEPLSGSDVYILQNLVNRDAAVRGRLPVTSVFDADTYAAVRAFQLHHRLPVTGIFDEATADELLACCSRDGVTDSGFTASSRGCVLLWCCCGCCCFVGFGFDGWVLSGGRCRYKYKINLPVHANRSIETMATLYDAVGNKVMSFRARKCAWIRFAGFCG